MLSSWSRIQTCTGNVITEGHMRWRTSAEANSDVCLAASTLFSNLCLFLIKLINIMNQWVLGVQQLSLKFNMMTTRFLIVQNSLPALSYFWGEIVAKLCRAGIPSTQLAQVGLGKVSAPPSWLLPPLLLDHHLLVLLLLVLLLLVLLLLVLLLLILLLLVHLLPDHTLLRTCKK